MYGTGTSSLGLTWILGLLKQFVVVNHFIRSLHSILLLLFSFSYQPLFSRSLQVMPDIGLPKNVQGLLM